MRVALANRYPNKLRDAAIAAVELRRLRNPRDRTIFREVAEKFGVGEQSLRLWVKKNDDERLAQAEKPKAGRKQAAQPTAPRASQEHLQSELDRMRKQIERLKAENDVLKRAFVVFSSEWGGED
jgi:transposase